jgi:desulfoferrodoxin-like iron-binding protein
MTTKAEVYKCKVCGTIIAVITGGKGELGLLQPKNGRGDA